MPRQRELEDKLRLLKNKKIHMDDILSQLSNFHSQAATSGGKNICRILFVFLKKSFCRVSER